MGLVELFQHERDRLWSKVEKIGQRHEGLSGLFSYEGDSRIGLLVDAASYGVARLREALSEDAPVETQAIVGTAMPALLRPMPAMTVVQWTPAEAAGSIGLPAGLTISSTSPNVPSCEFHTVWSIDQCALAVDHLSFEMRGSDAQILRLRLRAPEGVPFARAVPTALRVFVRSADPHHALDVVHALCAAEKPIRASVLDEHGRVLRSQDNTNVQCRSAGLAEGHALFPGRQEAFGSSALLRAFFAFPEAFCFVDMDGIRDALAVSLVEKGRVLELEIPLAAPLPDHAHRVTFELRCAPAVNVRSMETKAMMFSPTKTRVRLPLPPDVELYEVVRMQTPSLAGGLVPLRMWEHDEGTVMRRGELVGRIHRRASLRRGPSDVEVEILTIEGPTGSYSVTAELLITDGMLPERLLPGHLTWGKPNNGAVNISRVTSPFSVVSDRQLAWRANALARIPAADFATAGALRRLLDLHDVTGQRARTAGAPDGRGVDSVSQAPFRHIDGKRVHGGVAVDVVLAPHILGGVGASWVVGELLARALTERTDARRYSHLRWIAADGTVRADYGLRPGARLPFPFS